MCCSTVTKSNSFLHYRIDSLSFLTVGRLRRKVPEGGKSFAKAASSQPRIRPGLFRPSRILWQADMSPRNKQIQVSYQDEKWRTYPTGNVSTMDRRGSSRQDMKSKLETKDFLIALSMITSLTFLGIRPHLDSGIFTFLLTNGVQGLERCVNNQVCHFENQFLAAYFF